MSLSHRNSRSFRARSAEQLESRELLAGHSFAAGFASFARAAEAFDRSAAFGPQFVPHSHGSADIQPFTTNRTVLTGTLTDPDSGATGTATYKTYTVGGVAETKFTATISGAAADTTLDVSVDGVVVGQITTNANGAGKLELSSDPSSDETSLPADFPAAIAAGSAVSVGAAVGTLATPTNAGGGNGGCSHGDSTHLTAAISDATSGVSGTVNYHTGTRDGVTNTKLTVKVTGATADSTLDVVIDGVTIGQVTTDANGAAKTVFATNPTGDQQQLPADFPTTVAVDSTVTVGTLTGTFAVSTEGGHRGGGRFGRHH